MEYLAGFSRTYRVNFGSRRYSNLTFRRKDGSLEIGYRHPDGSSDIFTVPWSEDFEQVYNTYLERAPIEVRAVIGRSWAKRRVQRVFERYKDEMGREGLL